MCKYRVGTVCSVRVDGLQYVLGDWNVKIFEKERNKEDQNGNEMEPKPAALHSVAMNMIGMRKMRRGWVLCI